MYSLILIDFPVKNKGIDNKTIYLQLESNYFVK